MGKQRNDTKPWMPVLSAGFLALAITAAFSNSFAGPFIFDDQAAIPNNATIRRLWPIWEPFSPPTHGETVMGRPVLNFSFALSYAMSGSNVWGHHAMNLAIHVAAALVLFGLVRRTLLLPTMRDRWNPVATPLALVIALLWGVHPLQTESVTYMVQRAESLVGLFYLLTLYALVRGVTATRPRGWYVVCALACTLGMASKEVMVSAPLVAILYDRTFLAGSFAKAWNQRRPLYMTLAATWFLLACLVAGTGSRGGTAGFGQGISSWSYLGTQFGAIVCYLRLSVWPAPLVLDYGIGLARTAAEIVPYAMIVILLGLATIAAIRRWPKLGFLGACFFMLLAPTSSIVPVATQTIAEHRMYLPLAAVIAAIVTGGFLTLGTLSQRGWLSQRSAYFLFGCAVAVAGATSGTLTYQRNKDYQSELSIWQDTADKVPNSARAHNNLGPPLIAHGQPDDAIAHYRTALEIKPDYADAHGNLGNALAKQGQLDEAITHYTKALELEPNKAEPHNNFGNVLTARGKVDEAILHYLQALRLNPNYAEAEYNLAYAFLVSGRPQEAIEHFEKALRLRPDYAKAENGLGNALAARGRLDEATKHFLKALELRPDYAEAHYRLASALMQRRQTQEAVKHFRRASELEPSVAEAHNDLGYALAATGSLDEAIVQLGKALELRPDYPEAHFNLGNVLAIRGQLRQSLPHLQKAVELRPDFALAHRNLALLFMTMHSEPEKAISHFRKVLEIRPDDFEALNDLAWLLATCPKAACRNGVEAVQLAQRAGQLAGKKRPETLDTLAAAYAEVGRFSEALATAQRGLELALQQGNKRVVDDLKSRISLYEQERPFRSQ